MDRKMYRLLGFVALLIFLGLALWGLYEARKELDKITKKKQLVYVTDTAERVRILREEGTEIYLSNTPWNVYYLEYDVDEAMEIFTDYLLTPERTARFTIGFVKGKEKSGRYEIVTLQINLKEVITYQDYYDRKSSVIQSGPLFWGRLFSVLSIILLIWLILEPGIEKAKVRTKERIREKLITNLNAKEVSHDTFTLFYNQYLLLIKYKTGYFGADDYIRAYIFYNTTDLRIAELAEADYKTLEDKCLDYIIYLPSSRVPTERFFRRIDRKIAKLSFR
ncbi:MAG TPA: hypothetical protein GX007_00180 [Bacteroidales bacterium]|nr:hypothetical protein [Bacteroidales bacterium]